MYQHQFSNGEPWVNQPDSGDDTLSNDRYHQEEQTTLLGQHSSMNTLKSQQTSRPYVPENNSSDELDSYEPSMEMDIEANSDQCGFDTSSLSREDYYDDESGEEYDDDSSENRSMFQKLNYTASQREGKY